MSRPVLSPWSVEEFFAWHENHDERCELKSGLTPSVTQGPNIHMSIVVDLIGELTTQLSHADQAKRAPRP